MLEGTSVTELLPNWIELPVTDTGLIALSKFTLTPALVPTLMAELGGATVKTLGAVKSAAAPVVKLMLKRCTGTLSMLVTKKTNTEYADPAARLLVGAMLITWPLPVSV